MERTNSWKTWIWCLCVYILFHVLFFYRDWFSGLMWEKVYKWEEFLYMNLLMTEFECPEVTLCGWQDVKIQLPTSSVPLTHANTHTHACTHAHMHAHTHTHVHTHKHTHTHTHYPLISMCAVFFCVGTMVWLSLFGILSVHTCVDSCSCAQRRWKCEHCERVCIKVDTEADCRPVFLFCVPISFVLVPLQQNCGCFQE